MKSLKNQNGITLVALVITIIILIILAGITISMVLGEDGLIAKSKRGADNYEKAATDEQKLLSDVNDFLEGKIDTINSGNGNVNPGSTTIIKNVGDVAISDYGQYVNIGTNILDRTIQLEDGTTPSSDWRIFKKESNGVWLMLADYMPNSAFDVTTVGLAIASGTKATYGVGSSTERGVLINGLKDSGWSNLITGSSVAEISGVQVKGGLELEEWIASWKDSGYCNINTRIKNETSNPHDQYYTTVTWGYYIYKDGESNETTEASLASDTDGYANTLYFPHYSAVSECYGYRLASPSAQGRSDTVNVWCGGGVGCANYTPDNAGVRPAVFIPSSVNFDATNSVWTIAQ